jgi:hypothetical protein
MSMENHGGYQVVKTPNSSTGALSGNPTSRAIKWLFKRIWEKRMLDFAYEVLLSHL